MLVDTLLHLEVTDLLHELIVGVIVEAINEVPESPEYPGLLNRLLSLDRSIRGWNFFVAFIINIFCFNFSFIFSIRFDRRYITKLLNVESLVSCKDTRLVSLDEELDVTGSIPDVVSELSIVFLIGLAKFFNTLFSVLGDFRYKDSYSKILMHSLDSSYADFH